MNTTCSSSSGGLTITDSQHPRRRKGDTLSSSGGGNDLKIQVDDDCKDERPKLQFWKRLLTCFGLCPPLGDCLKQIKLFPPADDEKENIQLPENSEKTPKANKVVPSIEETKVNTDESTTDNPDVLTVINDEDEKPTKIIINPPEAETAINPPEVETGLHPPEVETGIHPPEAEYTVNNHPEIKYTVHPSEIDPTLLHNLQVIKDITPGQKLRVDYYGKLSLEQSYFPGLMRTLTRNNKQITIDSIEKTIRDALEYKEIFSASGGWTSNLASGGWTSNLASGGWTSILQGLQNLQQTYKDTSAGERLLKLISSINESL